MPDVARAGLRSLSAANQPLAIPVGEQPLASRTEVVDIAGRTSPHAADSSLEARQNPSIGQTLEDAPRQALGRSGFVAVKQRRQLSVRHQVQPRNLADEIALGLG